MKLSGIVPLLLLIWLRLLPVLCADMKSVDCSPVLHHHRRASYLLGQSIVPGTASSKSFLPSRIAHKGSCRSSMGLLWHRQEGDDVRVKLSGIVPLLPLVWLRPLPGAASSSKSFLPSRPVHCSRCCIIEEPQPHRIAHKGRAALLCGCCGIVRKVMMSRSLTLLSHQDTLSLNVLSNCLNHLVCFVKFLF